MNVFKTNHDVRFFSKKFGVNHQVVQAGLKNILNKLCSNYMLYDLIYCYDQNLELWTGLNF